MDHAETIGSADRSRSARTSAEGLMAWALGAGLLAGLAAWLVGEATVHAFQPKIQRVMTPAGPMTGTTAVEQQKADTRNAALAFAMQAACLGLVLGLAGGLARGSAGGGVLAGLAGAVLGTALALGAAAVLQPVYYRNFQLDQIDQSLTVPLLVHGGVWGMAGLAGGLAFGLGLGGPRGLIARAALGGLLGTLLAVFAFEMAGAMMFPEAKTTRPLSLTWGSRLMARMLVSLLSAAGAIALVTGRSAQAQARTPAPEPATSPPAA